MVDCDSTVVKALSISNFQPRVAMKIDSFVFLRLQLLLSS